MKLILERIGGTFYAYYEDEKHHKKIQRTRGTKQIDPEVTLPNECNLDGLGSFHMVFDVKRKPRKRVRSVE